MTNPPDPTPGACLWCEQIRPDHAEDCPVREIAEGLAHSKVTGEPFYQTVNIPPGAGAVPKLAALWDAEDAALKAAGREFTPIDPDGL